jgi:molybdopterin-guanine dinucleotide biosynthesis protein A
VLAGGAGRRLGQVDKPALLVGGRSLLAVALSAVAPALTVVVGPHRELPPDVLQTREQPPGGGPAAAVVAGLEVLTRTSRFAPSDMVAVLAADLPGIDAIAVDSLAAALLGGPADGAVLVDPDGHRQYLAGVWRVQALLAAANSRASWHGGRVSDLLGPSIGVLVPADRSTAADVDTTADLLEWGVTRPHPADG